MIIKLWKHKYELFIGYTLTIFCCFVMIICGSVLASKDISLLPILILGCIMLIFAVLFVFIDRRLLSKIIISEYGIEWLWLKKKINFISWSDITEITSKTHGRGAQDLSFIADNIRIDVGLTKEMYNAIMMICPIPNIKMQINNLECFKWFHRNKK